MKYFLLDVVVGFLVGIPIFLIVQLYFLGPTSSFVLVKEFILGAWFFLGYSILPFSRRCFKAVSNWVPIATSFVIFSVVSLLPGIIAAFIVASAFSHFSPL